MSAEDPRCVVQETPYPARDTSNIGTAVTGKNERIMRHDAPASIMCKPVAPRWSVQFAAGTTTGCDGTNACQT